MGANCRDPGGGGVVLGEFNWNWRRGRSDKSGVRLTYGRFSYGLELRRFGVGSSQGDSGAAGAGGEDLLCGGEPLYRGADGRFFTFGTVHYFTQDHRRYAGNHRFSAFTPEKL